MGMQEKLSRAKKEGYEQGIADALSQFEKTNFVQTQFLKGYWQGTQETFELIEECAKLVPGIGAKTQAKLQEALKKKANELAKRRGVDFEKIIKG